MGDRDGRQRWETGMGDRDGRQGEDWEQRLFYLYLYTLSSPTPNHPSISP
jgi:hypothetical protein